MKAHFISVVIGCSYALLVGSFGFMSVAVPVSILNGVFMCRSVRIYYDEINC